MLLSSSLRARVYVLVLSYGDAPARYPPYTAFNAKLFRFVSELYKVNSSTFGKLFKFVVLPVGIALGVWASWKTGHISFQ